MPESTRLVAVAAHGLPGSRTDLPGVPLSDLEWFDLVQGCLAADLVGFLAAAAGDRLPVTPGQADELAALDAERAGESVLAERRAVAMASILAAAAIDHRIVDGPARRLAYGDADVRQVRCVQVLVAADSLAGAVSMQGPPPCGPDGRPAGRRQRLVFRSAHADAVVADEQTAADPEAAAGLAAGAWPDLGSLGPGTALELEGREVAVLDLEQQLVVACGDVAASPAPALALLRDVAQIALSPALDATRARRLADASRLSTALARGVVRAWRTFDLADKTELSVWALRMGADRRDGAAAHPAPSTARHGLAQRVLGRLQPGHPAPGLTSVPPSVTGAAPAAPAAPTRSHQSSRR
ncbi:MAG TPA: hypothetical protein VFZ79_08830 [Acidimicrobiales bacterium]